MVISEEHRSQFNERPWTFTELSVGVRCAIKITKATISQGKKIASDLSDMNLFR